MMNEDTRDVLRRSLLESAKNVLAKLHGGEPETLDASRLIKPSALKHVEGGRILYWRNKAWAVKVKSELGEHAIGVANTIRRALIGKRSLTASDPYLHGLDLYVIYAQGNAQAHVPKTASSRSSTPSLPSVKFSKGEVTIATRYGKEKAEAEIFKQLAATKRSVTHVPSGMSLVSVGTMNKARNALKALVKAFPGIEDQTDTKRLQDMIKADMQAYRAIRTKYR